MCGVIFMVGMCVCVCTNVDEWVSDFLLTNRASRVVRSVRGKNSQEEGIFRFVLEQKAMDHNFRAPRWGFVDERRVCQRARYRIIIISYEYLYVYVCYYFKYVYALVAVFCLSTEPSLSELLVNRKRNQNTRVKQCHTLLRYYILLLCIRNRYTRARLEPMARCRNCRTRSKPRTTGSSSRGLSLVYIILVLMIQPGNSSSPTRARRLALN